MTAAVVWPISPALFIARCSMQGRTGYFPPASLFGSLTHAPVFRCTAHLGGLDEIGHDHAIYEPSISAGQEVTFMTVLGPRSWPLYMHGLRLGVVVHPGPDRRQQEQLFKLRIQTRQALGR